MQQDLALKIAREAFDQIFRSFPNLRVIEASEAPVEIGWVVPAQPRIRYEVSLSCQNDDELHFSVENFRMEWFPCTEAAKADAFVEAVCGYLSGRSRVLEHYRGTKCVKAELQNPNGGDWHTIATWSTLYLPLPARRSFREVRST